jgi:hypothetical protein
MENQNGNFQTWPGIHVTFGEILPGGVVLELVESSSGGGVELLRWEAETYEIGPQFRVGETIFTVGYVPTSLFEATRLAREPAEYGDAGTFFWKIGDLFRHYMGFSREQAAFMAQVVYGSWFPDCCASPVILCVTGLNMSQIMRLFRLLHVLSRRPLTVAALNNSLPFYLRPTLQVNIPSVSTRVGSFWRASNYRGTVIPGPRGTMRSLACAKIIFCETEAARRAWGPEALHIALLPTSQEFPSLSELEEAQLAAEYQPQLLMFRLRTLSSLYQSNASSPPRFSGFPLGGSLPACIAEDPQILEALRPMIEAHEHDLLASRARDPHVAIVESVWAAAHAEKEMSTAEITKRVNALLRDRGETYRYNSNEIGWKLRNLELLSRHNGTRKALRFSRDIRLKIHRLATKFGLRLPLVADCDDCKARN